MLLCGKYSVFEIVLIDTNVFSIQQWASNTVLIDHMLPDGSFVYSSVGT